MSWPYLPADFDSVYDSAWVWAPNSLYDPVKGEDLYREYINTLAYAEELGFDGICVNEHHQNAYGLMPSPNLIAAALTQRTKRAKIAVIGNALPLYNPPLRVAEEFAMLDVMSGGRLVAGMVIGGGPEYFSYQVNPTTAREVPRGARPHPQGVDQARAVHLELEALLLPLRQSLAKALAAAAPADLDSRRRQPRNDRVRGPAALRVHGRAVLPHRRLPPRLRHVPRCLRQGRLYRRPGADGLGRADLCRGDRSAGPRGIRAAFLVLRQEPHERHRREPARLHLREVGGCYSQEPETFSLCAEDLGRRGKGRVRHRRQPRDGPPEARTIPEGARLRRRADGLPDRHAVARAARKSMELLAREVLPHLRAQAAEAPQRADEFPQAPGRVFEPRG